MGRSQEEPRQLLGAATAPATSIPPRTALIAQAYRNQEAHGLVQSAVSHQQPANYSTGVLAIGAPSIHANTVTHALTVGDATQWHLAGEEIDLLWRKWRD